MQERHVIRAIALLEAGKGLLALVAASGLLLLLHKDIAGLALRLVEHAHLNPAARYPNIFIESAAQLSGTRVLWLSLGAAAYSVLRFVEAYGLFREKAWAEVLAAASGAFYVPFEIVGLFHKPDLLHVTLLLLNLAVVAFMIHALRQRRHPG